MFLKHKIHILKNTKQATHKHRYDWKAKLWPPIVKTGLGAGDWEQKFYFNPILYRYTNSHHLEKKHKFALNPESFCPPNTCIHVNNRQIFAFLSELRIYYLSKIFRLLKYLYIFANEEDEMIIFDKHYYEMRF